jgi:copper chaperone
MPSFEVRDMSCSHCASSITQAVQAVDPHATVRVDLDAKRVDVAATTVEVERLAAAIRQAGFTPQAV